MHQARDTTADLPSDHVFGLPSATASFWCSCDLKVKASRDELQSSCCAVDSTM